MKSAVKGGQRSAYQLKRNQGEQKIFFRMRGDLSIFTEEEKAVNEQGKFDDGTGSGRTFGDEYKTWVECGGQGWVLIYS